METIISNAHDGCERAEAIGLLKQLQSFSFLPLLWVFDDILGITKLLSDNLQNNELDLATAIDLVDSVQKTLTERRNQSYFDQRYGPMQWKMQIATMLMFTVRESSEEVQFLAVWRKLSFWLLLTEDHKAKLNANSFS